jgi:hypothetical protein
MTRGWLNNILPTGLAGKPVEPKPMFDGPPENPEYYLLASKPDARYANKGPSVYQIADAKEEQRLRKLRYERYISMFPQQKDEIDYMTRRLIRTTFRCLAHLERQLVSLL